MKPQTLAVLELLREFGEGGVTPSEARDIVGTDRLAARIAELRAEGFDIETSRWTTPRSRKVVARYIIHEPLPVAAGQLDLALDSARSTEGGSSTSAARRASRSVPAL